MNEQTIIQNETIKPCPFGADHPLHYNPLMGTVTCGHCFITLILSAWQERSGEEDKPNE
jgi:hypothetical protein